MEYVVYSLSAKPIIRTLITFLWYRSVILLFFYSPVFLYGYITHLLLFANMFARINN